MIKRQEMDGKIGGVSVNKKSEHDHCQILKVSTVSDYLTECENLDRVKFTLFNHQINLKWLWFSEDFNLKLGFKFWDENILKSLDLNYCYYNLFES